mgnify:CR=1 FL=1
MTRETLSALLDVDAMFLDYQVELTPAGMRHVAEFAPTYNRFTIRHFVSLVDRINQLVATHAAGQEPHVFRFGSEFSRVLYLVIRKGRVYDLGWTDETYHHLETELQKYGQEAQASEVDVTCNDQHQFMFRFWWD